MYEIWLSDDYDPDTHRASYDDLEAARVYARYLRDEMGYDGSYSTVHIRTTKEYDF